MKYLKELQASYDQYNHGATRMTSRISYIGSEVFKIDSCNDEQMLEELSRRSIEVATALTQQKVGGLLDDDRDFYRWFIIIRNMQLFAARIAWGREESYVWDPEAKYEIEATCMELTGKKPRGEFDYVKFTYRKWIQFMESIIEFTHDEMTRSRIRRF